MSVIDWDAFRKRIGGGEERARTVVTVMIEECSEVPDVIRAALAAGDAKRAGLAAHRLRSAAHTFGSEQVLALAERIEALAGEEDLGGAAAALPELESAVACLVEALTEATGEVAGEDT